MINDYFNINYIDNTKLDYMYYSINIGTLASKG